MRYSGGGGGHSFPPLLLTLLASTLGMALVPWGAWLAVRLRQPRQSAEAVGAPAPCSSSSREDYVYPTRRVGLLVTLDIASQGLIQLGLLAVGGGVYVVMYSSTTFWTACFAQMSGALLSAN
eukprot:SAG31_NODE_3004_length_4795_cov_2.802598_2_plen_122_part_00